MPAMLNQAVQNAIALLPKKHVFRKGSEEYSLRVLFPVAKWKPDPNASCERGSRLLGEDSCGNQFVCTPDGSVSFWDHETEQRTYLAPTVEAFLQSLTETTPVELKPGQIQSAWINPRFLEEQRRKGNA